MTEHPKIPKGETDTDSLAIGSWCFQPLSSFAFLVVGTDGEQQAINTSQTMSREQMQYRQNLFITLQAELDNDPIVANLAKQFIHGNIITLDECLFQMVRHLSQANKFNQGKLVEAMQWSCKPAMLPTPPEAR